jgi:Transglutaminase-like superfamily
MLLPVVKASLRLRGFKKTRESLESHQSRGPAQPRQASTNLEAVLRISRMVRAATRYGFVRASCLEESLTLWHLLRKQGYGAKLCIGVRKAAQKLEAHAWVEHDGAALNQAEQMHRHYAAFESEFIEHSSEGQ